MAASTLALVGCVNADFQVAPTALNEAAYTLIYPYYAEYCAVSEFQQKPGHSVKIEGGGPGGHSVFYLNGVCRVPEAGYPTLALCDVPATGMLGQGVGISVNAHFRNANWVATEGRDFFYHGDLAPGEGVTQASYARTQARAQEMGILDGVAFHQEAFDDRPVDMPIRDYMYEVSIVTDYAIDLGRDRYCARVPLDKDRMAEIVRYLNGLNAPYRDGRKEFHWNVLRNNCAYLAHNALAVAGIWPEWPIDRPLLVAAFDFPVPKNEFVNLMRRTNDMKIADPDALYEDEAARSALMQGSIPTRPGALAEARPVRRPNELYDTDLRLIFFDEAIFGRYQPRFDRIFAEPRYTDLASNLAHFSALYQRILAGGAAAPAGSAGFLLHYYRVIADEKAKLVQLRSEGVLF